MFKLSDCEVWPRRREGRLPRRTDPSGCEGSLWLDFPLGAFVFFFWLAVALVSDSPGDDDLSDAHPSSSSPFSIRSDGVDGGDRYSCGDGEALRILLLLLLASASPT